MKMLKVGSLKVSSLLEVLKPKRKVSTPVKLPSMQWADDQCKELIKELAKAGIVINDERAFLSLTADGSRDLAEILAERRDHERATIITQQLPPSSFSAVKSSTARSANI